MPADPRVNLLRHEPTLEDLLEGPEEPTQTSAVDRKSVIITKPRRVGPGVGKGRRSLEDMLASCSTPSAEATYAMERIAKLEDQIELVIKLCSHEARAIIIKERASLAHFLPDPDDHTKDE